MASVINYYEGIDLVAVIGNYLPRVPERKPEAAAHPHASPAVRF